jgi:carbamoyl-phosphate synthase large subunit
MDKIKVMITGAGALLGQGMIRSLKQSSLKTHIVGVDPSPYSAGLYWSDSAHLIPFANDPGYIDQIINIIRIEVPDAILIGTDVELHIFAKYRKMLEDEFDVNILVSNSHVIEIADDKYLTYKFLKNNGFSYPETCLPGDEDKLISKVGFPLIVKPRIGARSYGVHKVNDKATLNKLIKTKEKLLIQECVSSSEDEYTASALVFNGICDASIVMRRELRDGNTYRVYVEKYNKLNEEIRALGEVLKPHGSVNFQFRLDGNQLKVFEINSRFSGTTPLRAHAGFNEVELCLRRILWDEPIIQPQIEEMTILRHWSETIIKKGHLIDHIEK